jgi:catechol 2,3-dioxygenase-like lactoylglutathione lyase family enzyme
MITEFLHVGISVRDLNKTAMFFREVMGMKEEYRTINEGERISRVVGVENANMDVCVLRKGAVRIELLEYKNDRAKSKKGYQPQDEPGLVHIAYLVDDVDSAYERLKALGYEGYAPPMVARENGPKITYVKGPDNVIIELFQKQ